jgi:hypothetical protein
LNDLSKRASAQAENCRHSRGSFVAEEARFYGSTVFQLDNQRNQTCIRKVGEADGLVRLVKNEMVRQLYELQTGANPSKFFIRYGQQ